MSPSKQARLRALIEELGPNCVYCARPVVVTGNLKDPSHATREHLVPKSRGGKEVAVSCILCNGVKGDMTDKEYRFFLRTHSLADSYVEWMTRVKIRTLRMLKDSSDGGRMLSKVGIGDEDDGTVRLHQNGNTASA